MKNVLLIPFFSFLFFLSGFSQNASETNVDFMKGKANGISINLEGQNKNVEDVMKEKFKSLKGGKTEKGFTCFTGQICPEISSDMLDYYYKVEKSGDNKTAITLVISKGYDNYLTAKENSSEINSAKKMLENLVTEVRKYELGIAIEAQTKVYEKVIKENEKSIKDGEDLVKEQGKLEKDLVANKKNQEDNKKVLGDLKSVMEKEKSMLSELQKKLGEVK